MKSFISDTTGPYGKTYIINRWMVTLKHLLKLVPCTLHIKNIIQSINQSTLKYQLKLKDIN